MLSRPAIGQYPWVAPALVSAAGLVVLLGGGVLFYEGSEIFVYAAEYGLAAPMFEKPLRSSWLMLLTPLLVARQLTDDVELLSMVFAAPYALLPAVAVLFVVWSLKARSDSIAVALVGMCLVPLTWQLFFAAPWSLVNQLTWVLIACVVRREEARPFRILVPVLTGVLFFTHALSFLTFLSIGAAMLASSRTASLAWGFLLLGAIRLVSVFIAPSEQLRLTNLLGSSRHELLDGFRHAGASFVALYLVLLVASTVVLLSARPNRRWLSVGLQVAAAVSLLAFFMVNPRPWLQGVHFHYWSFATLPVLVLMFFFVSRPETGPALSPPDQGMAPNHVVPALVFLVAMSLGTAGFRQEMSRLTDAAAKSTTGCVDGKKLPYEFSGYPIYEFVFANNLLAWAGTRQPARVLTLSCEDTCWRPSPNEHHLFDLGALPGVTLEGRRCATTLGELFW